MGETTGIAWTDKTFNPWVGCTKVGPGCDHCYAEAWNTRFSADGSPPNWGPGAPRRRTAPANWAKVRKWNRDAEASGDRPWVFCASLADVFDNEAPPFARADLWDLVAECAYLRFQFLTKRIGNAAKMLSPRWATDFRHCGIVATVVTQKECDQDLPKLLDLKRQFGVAWVGLSIEPQLEIVRPRIPPDWVITGGESSQRRQSARSYDPSWARFLIQDGKQQGYPVFVKQMGSNPIGVRLKDRAGADPGEWPIDLRVREFPRTAI